MNSTVLTTKGKLAAAKEMLAKREASLEKLLSLGDGIDKELIDGAKEKVETSMMEIKQLESDLEKAEAAEVSANFDWATHESAIVKQAANSTTKVWKSVSFKTRMVINKTMRYAMQSLEEDRVGILIAGPTGSGKTTAVKWIGGEINRPVISQNFSNNMEEQDILGGPTIDASGKVVMKDGPLTEAVRYGLIYVAEEMNFAKPGVMAILNTLLDGNQQIILPSGEIVKAAPGFKFVGTINPGYAGTREFNKALINRFGMVIYFDRPTDKQLETIVMGKTGYGKTKAELEDIQKLILYMITIEKLIKKEDFEATISVRQLIAAVRFLQDGESLGNAIKYGIINQVCNFDDELETKLNTIKDKLVSKSTADLGVDVKEEA